MENFWQELIVLNANGVSLMQQGELESAEGSFTRGLRLLQRNVSSIETFVPPLSNTLNSFSLPIFPHKVTTQTSDFVALFGRALVLSGEHLPDASIDQRLTACSGLFLYNLGLTMHMRGLPEGDAKRLAQALQMYTLAWQAIDDTDATYPQIELGLLACANNIAHIHRYYHRIPDVTSCGRWMWQTLQDTSIPKEERSVLMSNALFYKQKDLSSAAAA